MSTMVARNIIASTSSVRETTTCNTPQHLDAPPAAKRQRLVKRKGVVFNETVCINWVIEDDIICSTNSWYNAEEVQEMKSDAKQGIRGSTSCRSDNLLKLLQELDCDNVIPARHRRESVMRREAAFAAVLKEQMCQWSFGEGIDTRLLAASYRNISKEAAFVSRRLALADEIVAAAILAGM